MNIKLNLNPDEALALIQILERDIWFPEVSSRVIMDVEKARHEWANDVRNMAYLRAEQAKDDEPLEIDGHVGFLRIKGAV